MQKLAYAWVRMTLLCTVTGACAPRVFVHCVYCITFEMHPDCKFNMTTCEIEFVLSCGLVQRAQSAYVSLVCVPGCVWAHYVQCTCTCLSACGYHWLNVVHCLATLAFSFTLCIVHCIFSVVYTSPFLNVSCIVCTTLCLTHCMYPHVPLVLSVRPPLLLCLSPHPSPSLPPAGSMVPFTLRLLHAQVPSYVNNHQLTVTRLCRLQFICGQVGTGTPAVGPQLTHPNLHCTLVWLLL